jgi:hypothetical protein
MAQPPVHNLAATLHALVDWTQARLNERESWDGVTLTVLSVLVLMFSSLIVYVAWAGIAYGGWLVWKKGSWKRLLATDSPRGPY